MSRRILIWILALVFTGASVGVGVAALRPSGAEPATASESPSPEPPPTIPAPPAPDPVRALPPPRPSTTLDPEGGYDVLAVQRRLNELHYYIGPMDGEIGPAHASAVMAFQKVQGLTADGVVGESTLQALTDPVVPTLRDGPPTRIEIDLTTQALYLVEGGELMRILPISSGSGQSYRTKSGGWARSLTPTGWFTIERRIRGVRRADLGILYDPMYFYRGWAIHGSNSVPAYPASHGCVRLTRWDAVWLFDRVPNGTPVHLYGGTHTFTAGSSAPGTDDPAGDTGGGGAPPPSSPSTPPTEQPPSEQPSGQPSGEPTGAPTGSPGEEPAGVPSDEPAPGESPSDAPSASPSPSPGPSLPAP